MKSIASITGTLHYPKCSCFVNPKLRFLAMTFLVIILLSMTLAVSAKPKFSEIFDLGGIKSEYGQESKGRTKRYEPLKIVFFSDINLYTEPVKNSLTGIFPDWASLNINETNFTNEPFFVVLDDQAKYMITERIVPSPAEDSKIVYKQTQLLLQESIRELLFSLETEPLDMVIFGGNQVYSSEQYPAFQEVAQDLVRYKVSYYEIFGENEAKGTRDLSKVFKDKFYLLKTKGTNIIILDNLYSSVMPDSLPYEATEQYLWLEATLKHISNDEPDSDLIIASYNELDSKTLEFLNKFQNLNLKVLINFSSGEFSIKQDKVYKISNPSLSWYPCAYGVLERDQFGNYSFELKQVGLKDIQDLAKKRS